MKLKIKSDGTSAGTMVLTEEGEPIEGVQFLQILISADEVENTVILELLGSQLDIEISDAK